MMRRKSGCSRHAVRLDALEGPKRVLTDGAEPPLPEAQPLPRRQALQLSQVCRRQIVGVVGGVHLKVGVELGVLQQTVWRDRLALLDEQPVRPVRRDGRVVVVHGE